jgi:hypothetical protein
MLISVKDVLKNVLEQEFGIFRPSQELKIQDVWGKIKITGIVENSEPEKIVDKVLYVNVKNSVWAQQISLMKAQIIRDIKESSGILIADIKTRAGFSKEESKSNEIKPESTCKKCGVAHEGSGDMCFVCERKTNQESKVSVARLVNDNSKLSYNEEYGLNRDDFRRVKRDMNSFRKDNNRGRKKDSN